MSESTAFAAEFARFATRGRLAALTVFAALAAPFANSAHAQAYPSRPITVIWPSTPGSSTENVLRATATEVSKRLGQQVLIENRPGANGTLGLNAMKLAKPDGYLFNISQQGVLVHLPLVDPGYSIELGKDYVPMLFLLEFPYVMAANPALPFQDMKGLVSYAKANPKKLNFAIQQGTGSHLFAERLQQVAGVEFTMVPYKSSAGSLPDLMAGQVDLATASSTIKPMVEAGKLKAVGVSSKDRWSVFPKTSTLVESGIPIVDSAWYVLVAAAGTPQDILNKVTQAYSESIKLPGIQKAYADNGLISHPDMTPKELAERIAQEKAIWEPIIRKAGIKLQ